MTASVSLVKGWCPGALRPMESGDGLIVRIRPRLGAFSRAQFAVLAEISARFGDGSLHVTSRANVQIRGIAEPDHPLALAMLRGAALLDGDARAEAVRNTMVTPQVALCPPGASPETPHAVARQLAGAVDRALSSTPLYHPLPAKFGIAIQAGAEIDSAYMSDVTFACAGLDRILIILDGAFEKAIVCESAEQAVQTLHGVLHAFIKVRERDGSVGRMRDAAPLVAVEGVALQEISLSERAAPLGPLHLGQEWLGFGIGFAFGEISQAAASEIVVFMEGRAVAELALAPHRALVFRCKDGEQFSELARRIGGITDPRDIMLRMHACVGAPRCSRAMASTRMDAAAVARALPLEKKPSIGAIHISGCEKRCASPRGEGLTAVAKPGGYELFDGDRKIASGVASPDLPGLIAERAMQS
jgi:precorrin-3B synthase